MAVYATDLESIPCGAGLVSWQQDFNPSEKLGGVVHLMDRLPFVASASAPSVSSCDNVGRRLEGDRVCGQSEHADTSTVIPGSTTQAQTNEV